MVEGNSINWFSYVFVIIITIFIVSIITEKVVINRLKLSEGVEIRSGKCRLKSGYGKLAPILQQVPQQQIARGTGYPYYNDWADGLIHKYP
jgi:hypothetical protein